MNKQNNLKNDAYEYIKEQILCCEYIPGQPISEKQIMETFGIGRTPVREALILLKSEDLVETYPRSGTIAKPITSTSIFEMFELRKLIEPGVAVQNVQKIGLEALLAHDRSLKEICENLKSDSILEFYREDIAFHEYLISCTNNSQLINLCKPLFQQSFRLGMFGAKSRTSSPHEKTYQEHHRIISAILEEDTKEIRNAFIAHLNSAQLSAAQTLKAIDISN